MACESTCVTPTPGRGKLMRMPREDPFIDELVERLSALGDVRARRMFGGHGLYCDDVFFGVVDDGVVYFRVDETTVGEYRVAGSAPFRPIPSKPAMLGYFEVPLGVQERDEELRAWARRSVESARKRKSKGTTKARAKAKKPTKKPTKKAPRAVPVGKLLNLGPKSSAWLRAVGIETRADLERIGSVRAYRKVREAGYASTVLLLYALEGALLELRWDRLPEAIKANLRERAKD